MKVYIVSFFIVNFAFRNEFNFGYIICQNIKPTMKKVILSILCVISATMAMAQANPKSGYVITNSGDTIRGIIDLRTNERLSTQCEFWANGEKEGKTYKPGDIEGFRFDNNGKYFVSRRLNVTGEPELYFAEYMVQGKMNLYCVVYSQNEYFFFEREDGEMAQFTNKTMSYTSASEAFAKHDIIKQEKKEQYGNVKFLLQKSMKAVIDMDDENLNRKKLINVVRDYHNDVCTDGSKCMVYEYNDKTDKVSIHFKAFVGYAYYSTDQAENQYQLKTNYTTSACEFGIGIDIDLKRVAKNFYAEVGLTLTPTYKSSQEFFDGYNKTHTIEPTFKRSSFALSAGVVKGFGNGKIHPLVRGGIFLLSQSGDIEYNGRYGYKYDNESVSSSRYGIYLGAGVQMPIGIYNLRLHADLNQTTGSEFGQTKWGLTAEFIL